MVHQELSLIPTLTVSENFILARGKGIEINRRRIYDEVKDIGEKFGIEVPPDVPIYKLSYGERQRVEILKALSLVQRSSLWMSPPHISQRLRRRSSSNRLGRWFQRTYLYYLYPIGSRRSSRLQPESLAL